MKNGYYRKNHNTIIILVSREMDNLKTNIIQKKNSKSIRYGTLGYSVFESKMDSGAVEGTRMSATMSKFGTPSEVWVPRTSLWTLRHGWSGWGCGRIGNQWTVREGHSREWEMRRSYRNGVFFFHTMYSSSTWTSPASCSSAIAPKIEIVTECQKLSLWLSANARQRRCWTWSLGLGAWTKGSININWCLLHLFRASLNNWFVILQFSVTLFILIF